MSNYQVGTRKLASRQGAVSNHTSLTHRHLSSSFFACYFYHQLCLVLAALLPSLRLHVMASQLKKYKKDVHQMSTKLQGVYNDLQEEQSHRMVDMFFISASKLNFSDFNLVSKIWNEHSLSCKKSYLMTITSRSGMKSEKLLRRSSKDTITLFTRKLLLLK